MTDDSPCDWAACSKIAIVRVVERRKDRNGSGFIHKEVRNLCRRHFSKMNSMGNIHEILAYLYTVTD